MTNDIHTFYLSLVLNCEGSLLIVIPVSDILNNSQKYPLRRSILFVDFCSLFGSLLAELKKGVWRCKNSKNALDVLVYDDTMRGRHLKKTKGWG